MTDTTSTPLRPIRPAWDAELVPGLKTMESLFPVRGAPILETTRQLMMTGGIPGAPAVDLTAGGLVTIEEREVPGPSGGPNITLLVLRPTAATAPLPGIYHVHGGGMISGDRKSGVRELLLPYVAEGKAVLVSPEYRLAPEHPDPAPVEDCYAGLVWTAQHPTEIGIDRGRLIIAGASAGGGLAAGTALLARDRGFPTLTHQILICPMLDDRLETPSSQMLDGEGVWDRNDNLFGWTSLLGDRRGGPDVSPYAAPARAQDLGGLPRTYLDCGSVESFRDEVLDYATRLSQAGVNVDLHMWGGGFHGFDAMVPHAAVSRAAAAARDEFVRRALET